MREREREREGERERGGLKCNTFIHRKQKTEKTEWGGLKGATLQS